VSGSLPILVVEDEEILLCFFKQALERGGFKVSAASSGNEALALLEQKDFAGVVCDLRLEGGTGGPEIFEWVRKNRLQLSSCFLFITGDASDPRAVELREHIGAPFIEKPFRVAQLLEILKKLTSEKAGVFA